MCKLFIFKNCAKMQKIPKNSKILINDGHFGFPHPQISYKQFSNICENVVYFFYYVGGVEKWLRILTKHLNWKKLKMAIFFLHFANTTRCNFKFWKIYPPYRTTCAKIRWRGGNTVILKNCIFFASLYNTNFMNKLKFNDFLQYYNQKN